MIHKKFILNSENTLAETLRNISNSINETVTSPLTSDLIFLVDVNIERNITQDECLKVFNMDLSNSLQFIQLYLRFFGNGYVIDCGNTAIFGFTAPSSKITRLIQYQNVNLQSVLLFGETLVFRDVYFGKDVIIYENAIIMLNATGEMPLGKISIEESRWRSVLLMHCDFLVYSLNYMEKLNSLWIYRTNFELRNVFQLVNIDDLIMEYVTLIPAAYDSRVLTSPFITLRFIKIIVLDNTVIDGFTYQTALSIEYSVNVLITHSRFSNNHVNSKDSNANVLIAKGLNQLHVLYSYFFHNSAKYGSGFEITGTTSLMISTSSFYNNTALNSALYLGRYVDTYYSYVRIQNSIFTDNISDRKGGAISIDRLTAEPSLEVNVFSCKFVGNSGLLGGAIYSYSNLMVSNGIFTSNTATQQGGAIFVQDGLSIKHSTLTNNSVISRSLIYCTDNNCIGSGGAVSFLVENDPYSFLTLSRNIFDGNWAIRGGALSMSMPSELSIDNNNFKNGVAEFAGGAVFVSSALNQTYSKSLITRNTFDNNEGMIYGNDMSSIVYRVIWKYIVDGTEYDLDSNGIKLHPGKVFSLVPVTFDIFDQYIAELKETSELSINNSDKFQLVRDGYSFNKIYISVINQTNLEPHKLSLQSSFSITKSEIPLVIEPCPSDTSLKPANYGKSVNFICQQKPSYDYVIVVAVTATIVTLSLVLGLISISSYLCFKIIRKIKYWMRRDKAEKDIERRLLENEITYMEDHSLHSIEYNSGSVKQNQPSYIISIDQIFPEKKIGEGGSGVVYLGKWHHHPVAIKCLKIEDSSNSDEIEKEAAMLCRLRHPNIVLFFGVSLTHHKQYLVVEYLEKGSLEKHIQDMKRKDIFVTFSEKLKLLVDVACGMAYLHSLKIIHRDLKPANILMDKSMTAKVCDFGISRIMEGTTHTTTLYAGTLFYLAPELLQSDNDEHKITTSVDVFSFSIIMWQLFFEDSPYINTKSPKIHLFQKLVNSNENIPQKKSSEHLTPFSVLARVLKGERPYIPWQACSNNESDSEIMIEWLEEYMPEFSNYYSHQQEQVANLVADYVELMKACWCENYLDRPNFETILGCLMILKQHMDNLMNEDIQHMDGSIQSNQSIVDFQQLLHK